MPHEIDPDTVRRPRLQFTNGRIKPADATEDESGGGDGPDDRNDGSE